METLTRELECNEKWIHFQYRCQIFTVIKVNEGVLHGQLGRQFRSIRLDSSKNLSIPDSWPAMRLWPSRHHLWIYTSPGHNGLSSSRVETTHHIVIFKDSTTKWFIHIQFHMSSRNEFIHSPHLRRSIWNSQALFQNLMIHPKNDSNLPCPHYFRSLLCVARLRQIWQIDLSHNGAIQISTNLHHIHIHSEKKQMERTWMNSAGIQISVWLHLRFCLGECFRPCNCLTPKIWAIHVLAPPAGHVHFTSCIGVADQFNALSTGQISESWEWKL